MRAEDYLEHLDGLDLTEREIRDNQSCYLDWWEVV